MINSPKIPVEDEPAGDLDVVSVRTIMTLLKKIHSKGMSLPVVTHERDAAVDLDQRICLMQSGRLEEITHPALTKEDLMFWSGA